MSLHGKIALITGGARGIGHGCGRELALAGADIILNDRPGSEALEPAASVIRALGANCWTVESDVFSRSGCEFLVAEALRQAGRIDILISNPALGKRGGFLEFPAEDFDRVVDATFKAGFHLSQLVARHMAERGGGGKIVFISSVHAGMPFARSLPYGAAKAALNQMARSIAVELFRHRINVNVIEPGWIDTPNERLTFSDEVIEEAGRNLPWGRLGTPQDIGRTAAFLSSDAADYITGVVLPVDGGFRFKDLRAEELPAEKEPAP